MDLFGLPGVGKSTICDPLPKPPIDKHRTVARPKEWDAFIDCVRSLLPLTEWHPSASVARRAIKTAIQVTAAVNAHEDDGVVVHRCFAHRGLSIACRMRDPEPIREFYQLMPVSVGVAHFTAPFETVLARFAARPAELNRNLRPEDMVTSIGIALEELTRRGVPLVTINTMKPVEESRATLLAFCKETQP